MAGGFFNQADALIRKNLTYQKRHPGTNLRLILFPAVVFMLLGVLQYIVNEMSANPPKKGPKMVNQPEWPPLMQVPSPENRAVKTDFLPYKDLPDESCKSKGSCPATILITGNNQTLGESVAEKFFPNSSIPEGVYNFSIMADYVGGTDAQLRYTLEYDRAFDPTKEKEKSHLYYLQLKCPDKNSTLSFTSPLESEDEKGNAIVECVRGLPLWSKSSSKINDALFKGYGSGKKNKANEILAAYDFLDSNNKKFHVNIWYNATYKGPKMDGGGYIMRISRSENMVSNAYLQSLLGPSAKMILEFIGDMPVFAQKARTDVAGAMGTILYTWIVLQLLPVIWTSLVYEKQQKLRIMMKMHGLGDAVYWVVSYLYYLIISTIYMCLFVGMGTLVGVSTFTYNDYSIQFVFYFVYINLQIAFAFLLSTLFSDVKTASVVAYIMVFATGLLGNGLFMEFINDPAFPEEMLMVMELFPGFALYRGMDELGQFGSGARTVGYHGMYWDDVFNSRSGMREVLIIMAVEWFVFIIIGIYLDQAISSGSGVGGGPLFFLRYFGNKSKPTTAIDPSQEVSNFCVEMGKDDVAREKEKVEQLLSNPQNATICYNLQKCYPGKDGNPKKFAVRGANLVLPQGECFGMLGPNGAGKTSFIGMMTGLIEPSAGTAYVEGLDLRTQMSEIYNIMGVCPQYDLLWDSLSGREHLLFYGRLKNLKGAALDEAVEKSLKSVDLFKVADKASGAYSGGMKRRLSVAISLIGDPKIVYLDEPSTGLDPASRNTLWKVVTQAKKERAIVLTTHSMEEAEHLSDRIGIFVNGSFQCLGSSDELKARFGETYVFTITTSPDHEMDVENLVMSLSPNARKTYHISGTQKFELPKNEVKISRVFQAVKRAKERFSVQTWGLADTSLEDVFIKVATEALNASK